MRELSQNPRAAYNRRPWRINGGAMTRKPKPPVKVRATVRIDAYAIIRERVELAAPAAVRRWLKHRDKPRLTEADIESLGERVADEMMLALGEIMTWGEP